MFRDEAFPAHAHRRGRRGGKRLKAAHAAAREHPSALAHGLAIVACGEERAAMLPDEAVAALTVVAEYVIRSLAKE